MHVDKFGLGEVTKLDPNPAETLTIRNALMSQAYIGWAKRVKLDSFILSHAHIQHDFISIHLVRGSSKLDTFGDNFDLNNSFGIKALYEKNLHK